MTRPRILIALEIAITLVATGCSREPIEPDQLSLSYSVNRCGGAPSGWSRQGSEYGELASHNAIVVGPASLRWNGVGVSTATLREYLESLKNFRPLNIQVVFKDQTKCRTVNEVRALVTYNLQCGSVLACVEYNELEYKAQRARHAIS